MNLLLHEIMAGGVEEEKITYLRSLLVEYLRSNYSTNGT